VIIHAARASNNRYAQVPTASGLAALAARGLCAKLFVGLRLGLIDFSLLQILSVLTAASAGSSLPEANVLPALAFSTDFEYLLVA
jgi:hypothetical protein